MEKVISIIGFRYRSENNRKYNLVFLFGRREFILRREGGSFKGFIFLDFL